MALKLEEIRALAERVAASHGLDVVELEYLGGGGKHRILRVFIEKNSVERARLRERVDRWRQARASRSGLRIDSTDLDDADPDSTALDAADSESADIESAAEQKLPLADEADQEDGAAEEGWAAEAETGGLEDLPDIENLELLSGVTHEDCEVFSKDFGVVLDVEELVPGTEYLLEVSSPGLDRKLSGQADFRRFTGALAKVQTFEPVAGNRHWQGRIVKVDELAVHLELAGKPQGRKGKKAAEAPQQGSTVEMAWGNIEKAQLVPEF